MNRPGDHSEPGEGCLTLALCDALRPALSLPVVNTKVVLTRELAAHAIERHKVAPLLHAALGTPERFTDAESGALTTVRASIRHNAANTMRRNAAERRAVAALADAGLSFSILKGSGLAAQLYDNSTLRTARDLDILIKPEQAREAIKVFRRSDYRYLPNTLKPGKFAARSRQYHDMLIQKDLTFLDRQFSVPIEVHRRLFKFEPQGLTRAFMASVDFAPTPSLNNAYYCLYLILHGSITFWHRLKWVADLSILLRRTGPDLMGEILALADQHGCNEAVISSAILAEQMFPGSLDRHWSEVAIGEGHRPQVGLLLSHYRQTLTGPMDWYRRLPLKAWWSSGSADLVFPGKIGFARAAVNRWASSISIRF